MQRMIVHLYSLRMSAVWFRIWRCVAETIHVFQNKFYLKVSSEYCSKTTETRGKMFCKPFFQVVMDLYKVQKQGGDENTPENYPTKEWWRRIKTRTLPYICCISSRSRVVFLFFFSAIILPSCFSFLPSFHSRVVFLGAFIPALFPWLLQVHPYLKQRFAEIFSHNQYVNQEVWYTCNTSYAEMSPVMKWCHVHKVYK